jgi:predicted ester cyclase
MHPVVAGPAQVFERIIEEGFNQGNLEGLADIVAPGVIEHQRGAESGLDGLRTLILGLREPFPDLHLAIEATATTGDTVWARIRARGTNTGSLWGRPPTGESMDITVIDVARVVDGKLVEHWGVADRLSMLQQLGIAVGRRPATAGAGDR